MPPSDAPTDFPAIARTLVETAERRVSAAESGLDRHIAKDEAAHAEFGRRLIAIELAMARAEGASLSRLLPWIALAVSAAGLAANLLR